MKLPKTPTDPSAIVVPFGKHKGKTVAEILATDQPYADWVMSQGWVAERFAELHAALASRGAGSDDTPEHNALQGRFLDPQFRLATLWTLSADRMRAELRGTRENEIDRLRDKIKANQGSIRSYETWNRAAHDAVENVAACHAEIDRLQGLIQTIAAMDMTIHSHAEFEVRGVDVVVRWGVTLGGERHGYSDAISMELKPAVGDDYPAVLREMKRLRETVLVVGQYTGRGISEDQFRQIFNASGFSVIFVQEIEETLRRGF